MIVKLLNIKAGKFSVIWAAWNTLMQTDICIKTPVNLN